MDRLILERAQTLFPDKTLFNLKETAAILGLSVQTLYNDKERYPFGRLNSVSQICDIVKATPRATNTRRRSTQTRPTKRSVSILPNIGE